MTASVRREGVVGSRPAGRPPGVLVVDDDEVLRLVLGRELRRRGFEVYSASSGAEAVETFRRAGRVDVVLLDVNMPGMSGPETLDAIRAADPAVRCCFMTADDRPGRPAALLARGAAAVLGKPFASVEELCETLERIAGETSGGANSMVGGDATWKS